MTNTTYGIFYLTGTGGSMVKFVLSAYLVSGEVRRSLLRRITTSPLGDMHSIHTDQSVIGRIYRSHLATPDWKRVLPGQIEFAKEQFLAELADVRILIEFDDSDYVSINRLIARKLDVVVPDEVHALFATCASALKFDYRIALKTIMGANDECLNTQIASIVGHLPDPEIKKAIDRYQQINRQIIFP